jgi:hypothetical protein
MTKDQDLEIVVPILGRAACECDQPAQQQVEDSEERGTAPFRTETRSYERADRTGDRRFSVPSGCRGNAIPSRLASFAVRAGTCKEVPRPYTADIAQPRLIGRGIHRGIVPRYSM